MEPAPRAGSEALPGGWAVARLGGRVSPPPPPPQGTANYDAGASIDFWYPK